MGDPFYASTQYNDIVGGAAFDGHEHAPLFELAKKSKMPEQGYLPVGFRLYRLDPNEDGNIPFKLYAVMCEESGDKMADVFQYAKTAEALTVYGFQGMLKPENFASLFKRIDIMVLRKNLPREKVVIESPPEE